MVGRVADLDLGIPAFSISDPPDHLFGGEGAKPLAPGEVPG